MSTDILLKSSSTINQNQPARLFRSLRWIGQLLLTTILILFLLVLSIPVLLLFLVTSVPMWIATILVVIDISLLVIFFRVERTLLLVMGLFIGFIIVSVLAVYLSQVFATTPPNPSSNGIASLETVELGRSEQWITIRGDNINNPVLLFLAGGPGGSELVMTRRYLSELEQHFVVVNWDQPGTGKSYHAVDISTLTPDRFVSDAYELTLYLRERFGQEKIYLLGESWGSFLGIWLVQEHPNLFHAFISSGQMINTTENDVLGYEWVLDYLAERGRFTELEQLQRNGSPPYTDANMAMRYMAYMNIQNEYMMRHAGGEGVSHNLMMDSIGATEYGLLDKVNWLRGLYEVYTQVYPQLADVDFRTQATHLAVPVYFIKGMWDINALNSLVEEYFDILEAPHKELIWFEDSAHTPLWDEPDHFVDVMVNTVLAQTNAIK